MTNYESAVRDALACGMRPDEAEHDAGLTVCKECDGPAHGHCGPHGTLVRGVRPRTGVTATCERCGQPAEALWSVPGRRWTWRHVTRVSPFVRAAVAGALLPKVLA